MDSDFDTIIDRRHSDSIKWGLYDEDVLPMWVADMDFTAPQPVIEALRKRVDHGVFGYPMDLLNKPGKTDNFRNAIREWLERLYHWKVDPEAIVFVPGVVTAFNLVAHALAGPERGVLIQTPVYPPIFHVGKENRVLQQETPLTLQMDGSYTIDFDRFEAAITPQTSMFLLCNPHNPVGRVFTRRELERMGEICLRHGVTICSDEIHSDLIYSGQTHIPIAMLDPELARHTITLMAPSKTFNIAGLECSYAIISDAELRRKITSATQGLVSWVNLMGIEAATAAYQKGEGWLKRLMTYLEANRDFLVEQVQDLPGIKMAKPEGTYLAWLDCRDAGIPDNPFKFFLDRGRLALNDGVTFGPGGEGFVRLNFGCPRALLKDGVERMAKALKTL